MIGKKILSDMSPYQQGKQTEEILKEYGLERVIKLASNENPYGYSKQINEHLVSAIQDLHIYPDGYTGDLRFKLADKLNVNQDELVFGSGSDEIIQLISRAFLYPGVNTVMATPTFPQYKHNALIDGAKVKEIPTVEGRHDLNSMYKAIDEATKVVWICSPDNPTGTSIDRKDFYEFMKKCPSNILVVLDEAYYEYVDEQANLHAIDYLDEHKNLILLRTFSKAYGLANLRIGYGIANNEIIRNLDIIRGPFNTSSVAQNIASIALKDKAFIEEVAHKNKLVKQKFQSFLNTIEWGYFESQTNFILVSTPISGEDVFQYLLEHGFIVRPGELLGMPNTVRITVGNEYDMNLLQKTLHKLHLDINKGI